MKLTDTQLDELEATSKKLASSWLEQAKAPKTDPTVILAILAEVKALRAAIERVHVQATLWAENTLDHDEAQYGAGCRDAGLILLDILRAAS